MKKTLLMLLAVVINYAAFGSATEVGHWRWRNDDGTETTATWKSAADQQTTLTDPFAPLRLRVSVYSNDLEETGSVILQYTTNASAATPGSSALGDESNSNWIDIPNAAATGTSAAFTLSASAHITGNISPTTSQLGISNAVNNPNDPFAGGVLFTTTYTSSNIDKEKRYEIEFTIKPTANIENNKVYYFRYRGSKGSNAEVPHEDNYPHGVPKLLTGPNVKVTAASATITALLAGAYIPATSEMSTALATNALLPATMGTATVANINTLTVSGKRVTDWVTVVFSKAASPGVPVRTYPALLLSNGKIVSPVSPYGNLVFTHVPDNYVVTIQHRNHLSAATTVTVSATPAITANFTTAATTTQKVMGNVKAMWPGDLNHDGEVGTSDVSTLITSFNNGDFGAYLPGDIDLDSEVGTSDVSTVKNSFLQGVFFDYGDL